MRTQVRRHKHVMMESERIRICMYLSFGGFHYKTIASRIYGGGNPRYVPSVSEVARIGKIAREENLSPIDWRRGIAEEAKVVLKKLAVCRTAPRLRLTA